MQGRNKTRRTWWRERQDLVVVGDGKVSGAERGGGKQEPLGAEKEQEKGGKGGLVCGERGRGICVGGDESTCHADCCRARIHSLLTVGGVVLPTGSGEEEEDRRTADREEAE